MLVCDTAGATDQDVEDLAVLVGQLAALGIDARIPVASLPPTLLRNARFDVAPHLVDAAPGPGDRVLVAAAHRLTDERLVELRRLAGPEPVPACAVGAFPSRQAVIGTRARLSYVLGADPEMIDLGPGPEGRTGGPVFGVDLRARGSGPPRVLLVAPDLAEPAEARALVGLALSGRFTVAVLTDGESKAAWTAAHGAAVPVFHYGEALPSGLARRVDIGVYHAPLATSYRARCLIANLVAGGAALVDASTGHALAAELDAAIPGPPGIGELGGFLAERILPNLARIEAQTRASRAAAAVSPRPLLDRLGLAAPQRRHVRAAAPPAPRRLVVMPTNGIGLGHAQRCAQIARHLDPARLAPVFAAFPGCMGLVKSYGFDVMPLVGRSALHALPFANDLPNYLRLRALTEGAAGLVFDGGYVFDSVYRTLIETGLTGVWIRRGLWQSEQDNAVALDREKAFARVIVPEEAFPELNRAYSRGEHLHAVGPVVARPGLEPPARAALREGLAERFGGFERLVVSLLGAGVAADRGAQIQALAGMVERRRDVLHLVVVWPSAVLQPAWFGWRRSRVVRTRHAGTLAAAADLLVTAAGYNSFHEVLYGRLPAVFIPQMGPFMDDQRSRAAAAVERGAAAMVEPTELVTLDRRVDRLLAGEVEGLSARLAALDLPPTGAEAAAGLIAEALDER